MKAVPTPAIPGTLIAKSQTNVVVTLNTENAPAELESNPFVDLVEEDEEELAKLKAAAAAAQNRLILEDLVTEPNVPQPRHNTADRRAPIQSAQGAKPQRGKENRQGNLTQATQHPVQKVTSPSWKQAKRVGLKNISSTNKAGHNQPKLISVKRLATNPNDYKEMDLFGMTLTSDREYYQTDRVIDLPVFLLLSLR